jgi:DNA-binding transcriptional LysR family regulator
MQERNVTRAGTRLGLSQPAISHALIRLRHMLKDDLFIRSPTGMIPTPRAVQLAVPVREALDGLQHSLAPTQFDPATANSHFRIAVDNYAAIVLAGPLAARVGKAAPEVTLDFRASGTLDMDDMLDRGELDLGIGPFAQSGKRFSRLVLLQDEFVTVLRKNHPAAKGELALETFAALPHLEISSVYHPTDFIDEALARRKLSRRIMLRAPFLSAVPILVGSDMVSTMPRRIAEELIRNRRLVIRPLPQSQPIVETAMVWPRRIDNQPAHRWLRDNVGLVAKAISR